MRKLYSALLVVALSAAMVLPVLAAPSPKADTVAPASAVEISVADTKVAVLEADVKTEVASVVSNPTHLTNLGVSTAAKLVSSFDLKFEGAIPAGGVQIPVKVSNAKVGDYAYILHRMSNEAGTWEVVGQGYLGADLTVTGTFTSFSPVAVLVVDAADVAAAGVKAPKTGEF